MAECKYFKQDVIVIAGRRPIGQQQMGRPVREVIPWCSHKHSPVPREIARTMGHNHDLMCEGTLKKCPLTPVQFSDE